MNNPVVSQPTVTTTPAVLFAGCGKVRITLVAPYNAAVLLGDSSVSSAPWKVLNSGDAFEAEFTSDAELYAASASSTQQVKIIRWF